MLGIFLDTETSGLDPKRHKILEIGFKIVDLITGQVLDQYQSLVSLSFEDWQLGDPASLQVNRITWEDTRQGKPIELITNDVKKIFKNHGIMRGKAVFICQNPSFDRSFFSQVLDVATQEALLLPYHWLDLASMFWAYLLPKAAKGDSPFPWETGFTKDKIAAYFSLNPEKQPHRALNGVDHLLQCYEAVLGFPKKKNLYLKETLVS